MQHHHDKVWAGHQGITRPQGLIKLRYYWPSLNKDVEDYVRKHHLEHYRKPKDHLDLQTLISADPIQLLPYAGLVAEKSFSAFLSFEQRSKFFCMKSIALLPNYKIANGRGS
jgi:hypothetical protein